MKDCPTCGGIGALLGPKITSPRENCDNCAGTGKVTVRTTPPVEDILDEARRITDGDRNKQYGPPEENLANIAAMWTVIFGVPVTAPQVALAMVSVKVCREIHAPHRDSWVDMVGYARCGWRAAGKP